MSIFTSNPQPISDETLKGLGMEPTISLSDRSIMWTKEITGHDLGDDTDPNKYGSITYYPKDYKGTDGLELGSREISFAGRCKITFIENMCRDFISDPLDTNIQMVLWIRETLKKGSMMFISTKRPQPKPYKVPIRLTADDNHMIKWYSNVSF